MAPQQATSPSFEMAHAVPPPERTRTAAKCPASGCHCARSPSGTAGAVFGAAVPAAAAGVTAVGKSPLPLRRGSLEALHAAQMIETRSPRVRIATTQPHGTIQCKGSSRPPCWRRAALDCADTAAAAAPALACDFVPAWLVAWPLAARKTRGAENQGRGLAAQGLLGGPALERSPSR